MLRFASKPDEIFLMPLEEAVQDMLGELDLNDDPAEQQETIECSMPHSSKLFTPQQVKNQLTALRIASADSKLLQPTDYHWLLLYECLDYYCTGFNEMPDGPLKEAHGIERIDFDSVASIFFWDTDFIDENVGLATRGRPSPEDLVLTPCDEGQYQEFNEEECDELFMPGAKVYPSFPDISEEARSWLTH
jgi:hypothetical protein